VDDEVDIGALGVEGVGSGRAEQLQPADAELPAQRPDLVEMFLDQRVHSHHLRGNS